jgi:hypothetical protein
MSNYNERGLVLPNPSAYSDMNTYYQTQFETFKKLAPPFTEFVWGGIPKSYGYQFTVNTNNYPKMSQLYKADAALYAKTCGK